MEFSFTQLDQFLIYYKDYVHWIGFALLVLAGFNLPISEDLVMIVCGSIVATYAPENLIKILAFCWAGAYISDIWCYLVGRYFLNRVAEHRFVRRMIPIHKIHHLESYFRKYGEKTLYFGRFIPFGARNAVFMTCGLVRMKMLHFLIIDALALCSTTAILFSLGYFGGQNYQRILDFVQRSSPVLFFLVIAIIAFFVYRFLKQRRHHEDQSGG